MTGPLSAEAVATLGELVRLANSPADIKALVVELAAEREAIDAKHAEVVALSREAEANFQRAATERAAAEEDRRAAAEDLHLAMEHRAAEVQHSREQERMLEIERRTAFSELSQFRGRLVRLVSGTGGIRPRLADDAELVSAGEAALGRREAARAAVHAAEAARTPRYSEASP